MCIFIFSLYKNFFLKTIDLTGASDSEIEEEEVEFLDIYLPKVPPPRLDVTEEWIVVDDWLERTPAPMPTAMKDLLLPVKFSFILTKTRSLIGKICI